MADNNPRNRQSPLFRRLTRLFSGPIVTYRTGQVKKNRAPNYEKYTFTSSTGREFKKKEYYNPFEGIYSKILNTTHRDQRYNDFDQMESVLQAVTAHPAFGTKPLGIKLPVSI